MLPIDRTSKSTLDNNLVNGNTSDAPVIKNSNDVVYNTIDELNNKVDGLVGASALVPYPPSFLSRQAIINGNFDVWQRGSSLTINTDIPATFLTDHWAISTFKDGGIHATITHSQATLTSGDLFNGYYAYQIHSDGTGSSLGANAYSYILQKIENATRYLCGVGKKVTISFWAKSDQPGKRIGIALQQSYGSGGTPSSDEVINGTTFTLNNTWTKYSFTFTTNTLVGKTFGTNRDDSLWVQLFHMWGTGIGTRLNSSTAENYGGLGNIFIAQIQVNAGNQAFPFQPRDIDDETKKSLRFTWIPQTNSVFVRATSYAANTITFDIPLPVQLRAAPTIRGVANTDIVVNTTAIAAQTGFSFSAVLTSNGVRVTATKTAHGLTDAYLEIKTTSGFDSEM